MNIDNGLGLDKPMAQPFVLPLKFRHALCLAVLGIGLVAALARCQTRQGAGFALAPPRGQMRGVQSFTPQQGADLAGLGTPISLLQNT